MLDDLKEDLIKAKNLLKQNQSHKGTTTTDHKVSSFTPLELLAASGGAGCCPHQEPSSEAEKQQKETDLLKDLINSLVEQYPMNLRSQIIDKVHKNLGIQ